MAWPTATITAGNYTSIRSDNYRCTQYISLLPNDIIQTTTLNTTPSLIANYAQLDCVDIISAGVEIGMTVLVTHDSTVNAAIDVDAIFRVRRTPSGTTLYINESDTDIRGGTGTWYVHIMDDYRIQQKLGRIDPATGTYYKDYDWVFTKPRPLITNLQSAYVGFIDAGSLEISFAPVGDPIASGATISSWLWDVGDGTITVGTTITQNITATFPEGFRWITLIVTDSNGVTGWRRVPIWAHGSTTTPATGFNGAEITGNWDTGYSAAISAFDGVQDYLDETLCVIWRQEFYDGTETNIINTVDFIGRLRNETSRGYGSQEFSTLTDDVQFRVEGPGQQLQRIPAPILYTFDAPTTPTVWDFIEVNTPKRTLAHILKESCTFAELHDVEFIGNFGDDNQTYLLGSGKGDLLSSVNNIAQSINGHLEFMPDGTSRFAGDVRMDFTLPTEHARFTDQDYLSVTISADHVRRYAKVECSGASYNSTSRTLIPRVVTAPGAVGTQGFEVATLRQQILSRNSSGWYEAWIRARKYLRLLNSRFTINIDFPDGYHWIMPSWALCYELDITSALNNRGYDITTSTFACRSISIRHTNPSQGNESGSRDVSAEFVEVNVVTTENFSETVSFPASGPQAAARDGNLVVVWTDSNVWVTREFKTTDSPAWYKITPLPDGNSPLGVNDRIEDIKWARYSEYTRIYMLTRDTVAGTARVWYKLSALDFYEEWKPGTVYTGNYQQMRVTSENEHLYIFSTPGTGNRESRFSDDSGQTFATAQTIGTVAASSSGIDVISFGAAQLAAYSGNVGIATTEGGVYSSYTVLSNVNAIVIPQWQFGYTPASPFSGNENWGTTTPEYLAGIGSPTDQLKKVTNSGATITDITPNDGVTDGRIFGPNSLAMSRKDGNHIAGLFTYGASGAKLTTSTDAGATWSFPQTLGSGSGLYLRMRQTPTTEIYYTFTEPYYSSDFGVTVVQKGMPEGTTFLQGIEVY